MTTLIEGAKNGIKSLFCQALKNGSNFAGLFPQGLGAETISDALEGASYSVCDRNPNDSDWDISIGIPPLFEGGQCDGTQYAVKFLNLKPPELASDPYPNGYDAAFCVGGNTVMGAITDITVTAEPNFSWGGRLQPVIRIFHKFGVLIRTPYLPTESNLSVNPAWTAIITPCYGASDNCGSLPTELLPIEELPESLDIEYDDTEGNHITLPNLPIKFFPPCIEFIGVSIPFEIDTPFGKICGRVGIGFDGVGIDPDFSFQLCPSQKESLAPAIEKDLDKYFDIGAEIGTGGTPFPQSSYGDSPNIIAEPDKPILGALVRFEKDSDIGKSTQIFNNDSASDAPDLLIPRLGYARFFLVAETEDDLSAEWSEPIDIKQPISFVPCPWQFGAIGLDVQAETGYKAVYKPLLRKSCCDACKDIDPTNLEDNIDRCR